MTKVCRNEQEIKGHTNNNCIFLIPIQTHITIESNICSIHLKVDKLYSNAYI